MEERISQLNRYLMGWIGYFRIDSAKTHCERFDQWLRRRLRMCLWKQWKRIRTRIREPRSLGVPDWAALMMETPEEEHRKCLETQIMPFQLPTGKRKG
nr:group II intron maturase-specific domain-containing protein [Paenibacillus sp. OSY-SE]